MALENTWHLRRVAENASKACWICYKPTTSVLITPSNKDFFYTCPGHLKDRGFCHPDAEEAAEKEGKKKQEELERAIEAVKREYEEKQKAKREKRDAKAKEKDSAKAKEAKSKEAEEDKQEEKAKEEKINLLTNATSHSQPDLEPRIFHLHKNIFQMRLTKLQATALSKRNHERLINPSNFPAAPSNLP